jgi:acyl carrier protein
LARIWQKLLRVERVGRNDNFFELGGHSLHAMQLIAAIDQHLRAMLAVTVVFQYPTIRQMAPVVESLRLDPEPSPAQVQRDELEEGIL